MQFSTLDQVVRDTQSPVGLQREISPANVDHPPLEGHPIGPQFTPKSQLAVGAASPDTSVVGNALEVCGGAVEHGFWVWL